MLRSFLFLILFFIAGCATQGISDQEKARLHLKIGTGFLNSNNYPQALEELLAAERLDNENPIIQNNLAIAYFVREKYSESEKHLRRAVTLDPSYTEARNNLGRTLIKLGLNHEAVKVLNIARKDLTYPHPENSLSNYGIALFSIKKFRSARSALLKSLKIRPKHCETFHYYARSLFELQKYRAAAHALDQAIQLCKSKYKSSNNYWSGMAYFKNRKLEQARDRFEKVLSYGPGANHYSSAQKMLNLITR